MSRVLNCFHFQSLYIKIIKRNHSRRSVWCQLERSHPQQLLPFYLYRRHWKRIYVTIYLDGRKHSNFPLFLQNHFTCSIRFHRGLRSIKGSDQIPNLLFLLQVWAKVRFCRKLLLFQARGGQLGDCTFFFFSFSSTMLIVRIYHFIPIFTGISELYSNISNVSQKYDR